MKVIEMAMPPMGESIFECTVLKWLVKEGDVIQEDDMILEVATDKIDTEIGSTHSGVLEKVLVNEGDVAEIGKPICLIRIDGNGNGETPKEKPAAAKSPEPEPAAAAALEAEVNALITQSTIDEADSFPDNGGRFYSPLVLNIAKQENISPEKLQTIPGSGKDGRVTKSDILAYIEQQKAAPTSAPTVPPKPVVVATPAQGDTVTEMDRMRKMIAERMVDSKRTAPHVTSFVEVDMTEIVQWRNSVKDEFQRKTGEKITFTPLLLDAVIRAIVQYPAINVQVSGDKIIQKKDINVGMAVALPNGNLIVPVIKNADSLNIIGLTKKVNDLAERARKNQLKPDELTDGTYTISNIGTFGNLAGTPIILQPQVGIMAFGVIKKVPAVVETPSGDLIGIRHKMIISHSYDHRVVDGSLGGLFAKQVADNLENMDFSKIVF